MYISHWFPCIVAVWVPFPFDQILKETSLSVVMVIDDGFYFKFFLSLNKIRRRPHEVGSMGSCFSV
jgi:hypothetical protein